MSGTLVLLAALLLATVAGLLLRRRSGRLRATTAEPAPPAPEATPAATTEAAGPAGDPAATMPPDVLRTLGATATAEVTLVQFSSAFCQPCRGTRILLNDVAETVPGVETVDVDAAAHLDLARRYHVRRTPTVLVVDGAGVVRRRGSGAPSRSDVLVAVAEVLGPPGVSPVT